jgi:hypothetical protein
MDIWQTRYRTILNAFTPIALLLLIFCMSCEQQAAGVSVEELVNGEHGPDNAEPSGLEERQANNRRLARAGRLFGVNHPEGLTLIERSEFSAHFDSEFAHLELVTFYQQQLTGYRLTTSSQGAKFEPVTDNTLPEIYIATSSANRTEVFYFRSAVEEEMLHRYDTLIGFRDNELERESSYGNQYPWPQGFRAGEDFTPLPGVGNQEQDGALENYEIVEEQRDGETITIYYPRNNEGGEIVQDQDVAESHRSFSRDDHQRSLRRPSTDRTGASLPFAGTRRVSTR